MILLGFPTIGLIGSIAGNYIANSLKLDLIGSIQSRYFLPSVIIRNSKPLPPVRIYHAKKEICGKKNDCDHLLTIVTEFPIPNQAIYPLIDALQQWGDKNNISFFLGLEGIKSTEKEENQVDVFGVGSTQKMVDTLKKYKIENTKEGFISGLNGALLAAESERNKDMLCLMTEAHIAYPDSRAAGRLLEVVDDMLPGINLDLKPLYEEAENLENEIKRINKQSQQIPQSQQATVPGMFQ
jgi:uncharacterized protein